METFKAVAVAKHGQGVFKIATDAAGAAWCPLPWRLGAQRGQRDSLIGTFAPAGAARESDRRRPRQWGRRCSAVARR